MRAGPSGVPLVSVSSRHPRWRADEAKTHLNLAEARGTKPVTPPTLSTVSVKSRLSAVLS